MTPQDATHDHHTGDAHGVHGRSAHGDDDHEHRGGIVGLVQGFFAPHSHDAVDSVDSALESSEKGIRAVKISLVVLLATSAIQVVLVLVTGSVALLADTIHNFADALTAVPLWIAFVLGRRAATKRYTYGYGRSEDLAGIVGFAGNGLVALYRIRVGTEIGSAALVADGYHARTDGLTSLAVVLGAIGVFLGFPQADPIVGLLITVAILRVLKGAAVQIFARLMDAVDPALTDAVERASAQPGVVEVTSTRLRWIGHRIEAEAHVTVDSDLTTLQSHAIAETVRHAIFHGCAEDLGRHGARRSLRPRGGRPSSDDKRAPAEHAEAIGAPGHSARRPLALSDP